MTTSLTTTYTVTPVTFGYGSSVYPMPPVCTNYPVNIGGNYYPTFPGVISNNYVQNNWSNCRNTYDLSKMTDSKDFIFTCLKQIIKDILYILPCPLDVTYDKMSSNYFSLVENDLDGDINTATDIREFFKTNRSLAVVAYDIHLNRLEMSSMFSEESPVSNIDNLLDDKLQIKENKEEYFMSLKSRFLPLVNLRLLNITDNIILTFEKDLKQGILPFIHTSNYLFNPLYNSKSEGQKASDLLSSLTSEALLIDKSHLPDIQPYFSPEYCYLSLQNKEVIQEALETFDKSKEGLINFLNKITVPGTNVIPFIETMIDHCAMNQNIVNIERYAYITLRHLIESNLI